MGVRAEVVDRFYALNIVVQRDPSHVIWNVAFPSLMVLVFSLTAYAMPIAELSGRLEITSTCLLGMMAFQGTIKEMLPPMPYLTAMGKYVIMVFIFLVAHGIEHAMAFVVTSRSDSTRSREDPSDFFLGTLPFWHQDSEEPVHGEAIWFLSECIGLILFHVGFLGHLFYKRRKLQQCLKHEAERPGISLDFVATLSESHRAHSAARASTTKLFYSMTGLLQNMKIS